MRADHHFTRRRFLKSLAALPAGAALFRYEALAAAEKGRVKIRDVKTMMLQGPDRNYTLVRIDTDAGVSGIGEGYGSPGVGVKEQVQAIKPLLIGKDPLEIDLLYTNVMKARTDGSAHNLMRAVSGIEVALWDTAGKILGVPATTLLGGKFRDRVRMYNHASPRNMLDKASCREWVERVKADPSGFTAHKFGFPLSSPANDSGKDPSNRVLTTKELLNIRRGYENCREAIGFDHDIMVHCHWEYDVRTAIQLAEAVEPVKPLWLEDAMIVNYSDGWRRLTAASEVPICTGENLGRRQDFKDFIVNQGLDIVQPDIRNSGGLLETKRIADFAEVYGIPMSNHNTGSLICTMATVQMAAAVRDYLACETVIGRGGWMDQVVLHDGPVIKDGFMPLPNKPGLGLDLNPDVVRAHLATGEVWWG